MKPDQLHALLKEIERRKEQADLVAAAPSFNFEKFAFEAQYDFLRAPGSRFRTAVCSRRSGKTTGIIGDIIDTLQSKPGTTSLYITLTRDNVRKILWSELTRLLEENQVECKTDNLRLEIKMPNGSRLITGGAKDRSEIEKYRGLKLYKVYIDEAQSFRTHIKELIDDVLIPALRDLRGSLYLIGTPGPVPTGTFYEYSHNDAWQNHHWNAFSNPHMHNPAIGLDLHETLREEREMRGIDENDPSYRRETYGEWVEDLNSLVFRYEPHCHYNALPNLEFNYIIGVDIGYNDSDAIAVLAYSQEENKAYLVEEIEQEKQDITALAETITTLRNRYKPIKMVMDAGALGKKIQEELRIRHRLNIEAADKNRKFEFISFLNADLRRELLKIKKDSLFAQDAKLVTWDRTDPLKPKISNTYHSDIHDAVLYAYREARHYLYEEPEKKPKINTDEYMDEMERKLMEESENKRTNPFYDIEKDLEDFDYELDWGVDI